MAKLQKRPRTGSDVVCTPIALQAGLRSLGPSHPPRSSAGTMEATLPTMAAKGNSHSAEGTHQQLTDKKTPNLRPFADPHRRAVSANSSPAPPHWPLNDANDASKPRQRKIIQLNSPPGSESKTRTPSPQPVPQAHVRTVSEGAIKRGSPGPLLSIEPIPVPAARMLPHACRNCGKPKRPASVPVKSAKIPHQSVPAHQIQLASHTNASGARHTSVPPPRTSAQPQPRQSDRVGESQPQGPLTAGHSTPFGFDNENHIISPLSPRRKVDFALHSNSSSTAASYSRGAASASEHSYNDAEEHPEEVALGTGRLINLISNAIRDTSSSPPTSRAGIPVALRAGPAKYTQIPANHRSGTGDDGFGLGIAGFAAPLKRENTRLSIDTQFEPVELDSTPLHNATADILTEMQEEDHYGRSDRRLSFEQDDEELFTPSIYSRASIFPLPHHDSNVGDRPKAEDGEYTEYLHDWTDAISIPVIRMPSVTDTISRFKSLRGPGLSSSGSVLSRFGSLRGRRPAPSSQGQSQDQGQMQTVWYGGLRREAWQRYQPLESAAEIGAY